MLAELLIGLGVVAIVGLFIIRTGKRPDDCTCKSYNSVYQGPVNGCPVHKHYLEDDKEESDEPSYQTVKGSWYKGGHYPFS